MLKAEEDGEEDGQPVVEAKKWRRLSSPSDKGYAGREQESIVVVAYEAVFGEEGMLETRDAVAQGPLGLLTLSGKLRGALVLIHLGCIGVSRVWSEEGRTGGRPSWRGLSLSHRDWDGWPG